jgi:hypothetical protein
MVWSSASSTLIGPFAFAPVFALVFRFSANTHPLRLRWCVRMGIVTSKPFGTKDQRLFFAVAERIPTVRPASSSSIHRSAWRDEAANFA